MSLLNLVRPEWKINPELSNNTRVYNTITSELKKVINPSSIKEEWVFYFERFDDPDVDIIEEEKEYVGDLASVLLHLVDEGKMMDFNDENVNEENEGEYENMEAWQVLVDVALDFDFKKKNGGSKEVRKEFFNYLDEKHTKNIKREFKQTTIDELYSYYNVNKTEFFDYIIEKVI